MAAKKTKKAQKTPAGDPIYRHQARTAKLAAPPTTDTAAMKAIVAHFAKHIGEADMVLHEMLSASVHIDVHLIAPTKARAHWVLFTTGMSDRAMTIPRGVDKDATQYAELMISLPADWKLDEKSLKQARWYWPVELLKTLARGPHVFRSWLGPFHTIASDPPEPYAKGTKLCGAIVMPSPQWPRGKWQLKNKGRVINFYSVFPLTAAELALKLEDGVEALIDVFEEHEFDEVIAPKRKSMV